MTINRETPNRRTYTADGRVGKLVARGAKLKANVVDAVVSGSIDLTSDGSDQLTIGLTDPDLDLLRSRLFEPGDDRRPGSRLDYGGLRFEVAAVDVNDSGSGIIIGVTARALGAQRLRRAKGALVRRDMSPTRFVELLAKAEGLEFLGEKSAPRNTIARQEKESSADTIERLASELGYISFESAGVLHFGRPSWFVEREETPRLRIGWEDAKTDPRILTVPTCRMTGDDRRKRKRVASVEVQLLGQLGDDVAPGNRFVLDGVPTFDGAYMVERVAIPLDDEQPVTVSAVTPVNPKPLPPPKKAKAAGGSSGGGSSSSGGGRRTASAFVEVALAQAGDTYIYGAEASASDPNPNAFDCSELVQWAAARVGVPFVDGSSAQIAACKPISVEAAIRTRGALLHHPGHIAISLGNGRTIEAANSRVGVVSYNAAGRFSRGGLIPGMIY